jgi:GTP cyclohydrolase I
VKKFGASTVTTQFTGVFKTDREEQRRFLDLLRAAR